MPPVRRADTAQIALELRHLGEVLITPCPCDPGHDHRWLKAHTIGEHIWDATLAMTPGPRAQAFTPHTLSGPHSDAEPPPEPDMHRRYTERAQAVWGATRALQRLVDTLRPDQTHPTGSAFTDDEWCRNHLDTLGVCEPRYRGDTCRRCYGVRLTTGHLPPRTILEAWRAGNRVTDQTLAAAIQAANPKTKSKGKTKRKKAG